MDNQVVSSVWKYESKYDLHIDKFLELLLKYGYVWCEQDEKDYRINLSNDAKTLLAEDFREFQKGLTSFDIVIQVKNIRKLYKKKLLELKQAGESEKDIILPWFHRAHRLFSDKTDKGNKILNHENISVSLYDQPATASDITTPNFQEKSKKPTSLPPNQVVPSSKSDIGSLTPKRTAISTTTTFSFLRNVNTSLMADSRLYAVGQPSTPAKDLSNAKPVLKATVGLANKSYLGAISKASITSPPENTTTSKIRHSVSSLTCMSPASRIPMRRSITSTYGTPMQSTESSTFKDHVRSTTSSGVGGCVSHTTASIVEAPVRSAITSTVGALVRSTTSIVGAPMLSTTSIVGAPMLSTTSIVGAPMLSTTISTVGAPVRSTTSSTFRAPVRSTNAFSVDQSLSSPVVISSTDRTDPSPAATSSRIQFSHSKNTPSGVEVSLPQMAKSCKTRILRPVTAMVARSKGPIFMNAQSSPVKHPIRPHNPATSFNRKVPVSLVASSSKIRVQPSQIALKPSADVSKSAYPSFSSKVSTSAYPSSSSKVFTSAYPSSSSKVSTSAYPSSSSKVSGSAYPSSSSKVSTPAYLSSISGDSMTTHLPCSSGVSSTFYPPYRSDVSTKSHISSSSSIPTPVYLSSSSGVSTPAYPSSPNYMSVSQSFSLGISPPAYPSSSSGVLTSDYPSSLNFKASVTPSFNSDISTPAYPSSSPGFHASNATSSTADSYTSAVALSSITDFTSSATSSSTGGLTVAPSSSGKDILTSDTLYSKGGLPLMPYRSPPPYDLAVPISTVVTSSTDEVFFPKTSSSPKADVFTPVASFSSAGLPLSPTTPVYRSKVTSPAVLSPGNSVPVSETASCPNTAVPLCPTQATSPTPSLPDPQISPLKYPFSPRKVQFF